MTVAIACPKHGMTIACLGEKLDSYCGDCVAVSLRERLHLETVPTRSHKGISLRVTVDGMECDILYITPTRLDDIMRRQRRRRKKVSR
jgi:hypothetical protein